MTLACEEISHKIHALGGSFSFDKVPSIERKEVWFVTLVPIVNNLLKRDNPAGSRFIQTLFDKSYSGWNALKNAIVWAQANIENWEQIFAISARTESSNDPDTVIYAALAEITAAKYLFLRWFERISFNKTGIDISSFFQDQPWNIEVTFISGEDFKTQVEAFPSIDEHISPTYCLESRKLISRLKSKYQEEEKQLGKWFDNKRNCAIVIVTHLFETRAQMLSHDEIDGLHPIQFFVKSCVVPTIVIGSGSIYEPVACFINGRFPIEEISFYGNGVSPRANRD